MTPPLVIAIDLAALLVGGIALLWLRGWLRTITGAGGRCWMCEEWKAWPNPHKDDMTVGDCRILKERRFAGEYACGDSYYRRKWWLIWESTDAPGSGG